MNMEEDEKIVKRCYRVLLLICLVEVLIVLIMNKNNIRVNSWVGNAIGAFIFLLPIQFLFFLLSKDEKFSKRIRVFFKIMFYFIISCYLLGGVAKLIHVL